MKRADFQALSRIRLKETKALLELGFWDGAYYLAGYAVECALKACIAKSTQRYAFPERKKVEFSYSHNSRGVGPSRWSGERSFGLCKTKPLPSKRTGRPSDHGLNKAVIEEIQLSPLSAY